MNLRLLILKLRNSQSWSTCKFLVVIGYVIFMILTVVYLFKKSSVPDQENSINTFETLRDLRDVPAEVLEFEAKVSINFALKITLLCHFDQYCGLLWIDGHKIRNILCSISENYENILRSLHTHCSRQKIKKLPGWHPQNRQKFEHFRPFMKTLK